MLDSRLPSSPRASTRQVAGMTEEPRGLIAHPILKLFNIK